MTAIVVSVTLIKRAYDLVYFPRVSPMKTVIDPQFVLQIHLWQRWNVR